MHVNPICQAAPEWKAANKSGDLLLEIRCLAALNWHLARWWGHPNPGLAPDRQIRIGTGIQYNGNKDVTEDPPMNIWMQAKQISISMEGPSRSPLKGKYDTKAIHFFAVNLIWKF